MKNQEEKNKALFDAVYAQNLNKVKEAIAEGAEVNSKGTGEDAWCGTALHSATRFESVMSVEIVDELLKAGADVNATNPSGDTPLHMAINSKPRSKENTSIILSLLVKKPNIFAINNKGQTALDVANLNEKRVVCNILTPLTKNPESFKVLQNKSNIIV